MSATDYAALIAASPGDRCRLAFNYKNVSIMISE